MLYLFKTNLFETRLICISNFDTNAGFLARMMYYIKINNVRWFILAIKISRMYAEFINVCNYNNLCFVITIISDQSLKLSL